MHGKAPVSLPVMRKVNGRHIVHPTVTYRPPRWWPYAAGLGGLFAAATFYMLAATRPPPTTGEDWDGVLTFIFAGLAIPLGVATFGFGAAIGRALSAARACVVLSIGWTIGLAVTLLPGRIAGRIGTQMGTVMFLAFLCAPIFSLLAIYLVLPPEVMDERE